MDPDLSRELEEQIRELNATLAQLGGVMAEQIKATSSATSNIQQTSNASKSNKQATTQNSQAQDRLNEANKNASEVMAKASQNFSEALGHGVSSLNSFGSALFSAEQGMSKYGKAADSLGQSAFSVGQNFGLLGTAVGGVIAIFGKVVGEVFKLTDNIVNTRDSFAKVGGILPTTLTGLDSLAKQAGFALDDMQKLSKATNSLGQNLLGLGGYAGEGAIKFMKMVNVGEDVRMKYDRLGVSQEHLLALQGKYVEAQRISGQAMENQSKSSDQLRRESLAYADNLIKMSSLTGKSADELEQQANVAMMEYEEQVQIMAENKKIADLRKQGRNEEADAIKLEQENRDMLIRQTSRLFGDAEGQMAGRLMRQGAYDEKTAPMAIRDPNFLSFVESLKKSKNAMGDINRQAGVTMQKMDETAVRYGKGLQYVGEEGGKQLGLAKEAITERNKYATEPAKALEQISKTIGEKKEEGTDPYADNIAAFRSFERQSRVKLQDFLGRIDPLRMGFDELKKYAIAAAVALGAITAAFALPAVAGGVKSLLSGGGGKLPTKAKYYGMTKKEYRDAVKEALASGKGRKQLNRELKDNYKYLRKEGIITKTGASTGKLWPGASTVISKASPVGKVTSAADSPGAAKTGGFLMSIVRGLESAGKAGAGLVKGAGYLSAAIAVIGAGIAAATWLMGAALPNLAKGLKSFEKLNGPNLKAVGIGMAGLGAGILAMGAGQVAGAIGNVVNWFVKGEDPLENSAKQIKKLEALTLNTDKIKNNSEAVVAFAKAMSAASSIGAGGAVANMAKGIADSINAYFEGKPVTAQLEDFSKLNIDSKNVEKNASAFKVFAEAIASYKGYGSNSGAAGAAIADATSKFFNVAPPYQKMVEFTQLKVDDKQVKKNANAFKSFAEAIASYKGYGSNSGAAGAAIAEATAGFFNATPPYEKMVEFGNLEFNGKKVRKNAIAFKQFAEAMASFTGFGSTLGAIGYAIAESTVRFFGAAPPLDQFLYFSYLPINEKRTRTNATSFRLFSEAMASYKGLGKPTGAISTAIAEATYKFFGVRPPLQQFVYFSSLNIDPKKTTANAKAFVSFSNAMAEYKGGPGLLDTISSLIGKGFGAIFGEDGPVEAFEKFAKTDFGPKASQNADAFYKYAQSAGMIAQVGGGSPGGGGGGGSPGGGGGFSGAVQSGLETGARVGAAATGAVGGAIAAGADMASNFVDWASARITGRPTDVLTFTKNSGSYENFAALTPETQKAVVMAATEYKKATGRKMQVNSARRAVADQERLYNETIRRGTPGIGPGGMLVGKPPSRGGNPPHLTGKAIDLQEGKSDASRAIPILAKYNMKQTYGRKDPVHFDLKARDGGIFEGPDKGYPVTMHGSEMIAPLEVNSILMKLAKTPANAPSTPSNTAPKTMSSNQFTKSGGEISDQATMNLELYGMITKKIDAMINVLENSQDTQTKMLRHARV